MKRLEERGKYHDEGCVLPSSWQESDKSWPAANDQNNLIVKEKHPLLAKFRSQGLDGVKEVYLISWVWEVAGQVSVPDEERIGIMFGFWMIITLYLQPVFEWRPTCRCIQDSAHLHLMTILEERFDF